MNLHSSQVKVEEAFRSTLRLRPSQSHDTHPTRPRSPWTEGLERTSIVFLLIHHRFLISHFPIVQEGNEGKVLTLSEVANKNYSQLAADSHHPQIAAHGPWDHHGRNFDDETTKEGQNLAYNAYA